MRSWDLKQLDSCHHLSKIASINPKPNEILIEYQEPAKVIKLLFWCSDISNKVYVSLQLSQKRIYNVNYILVACTFHWVLVQKVSYLDALKWVHPFQ